MYKTYATGDLDVNDGTSFLNFYPANIPEGEMRKSDALAVNIIHNETSQQDFRWIALDLPLIHIDDVDNASQGCCACSTCGAEAVKLALIPGTELLIDVDLFADLGGDWGALFTSSQSQTDKGPSFNTGDIAGDATTTTSISIGGSISSSLEVLGDHDWIEFTITAADIAANNVFVFTLNGTGANALEDPLLQLRDASGNLIAENDDGGPGLNSRLVAQLGAGTYYLDVQAWNNSEDGDYTLTADYRAPLPTYTLDQVADYLTGGSWTPRTHDDFDNNASNGTTIRYYIGDLPAATQALALAAMEAWAAVANLNFVAATSAAASDIRFEDNDPDGGAFAATSTTNGGTTISSVRINVDAGWNGGNTDINSYTYQTYIHEIGHALGLGHGGPYNGNATYDIDNIYTNDSWGITVMSYFDQGEAGSGTPRLVLAPQLADILAIQNLYGANTTYRNGDTVYGFNTTADVTGSVFDAASWQAQGIRMPSVGIWDTGGNDTLDFSGYSSNQRISLIAETWSDVGDNTNTSDTTDPLFNLISIARGAIIENAIGGSGDDVITGNSASNVLEGNAGDDILDGGAGTDYAVFNVSAISDLSVGDNGDGTFTVVANTGSDGTDTLSNIEFVQVAGQNYAIAGLVGSSVSATIGNDVGNLTVGDDTFDALAGNDEIFGLAGNDIIFGNTGADILHGDNGNDNLDGGAGSDQLFGGAGDDVLNGGLGVDTVDGGDGIDTLDVSGATNTQIINLVTNVNIGGFVNNDTFISIENVLGSDTRGDNIIGSSGANALYGNGASDILRGFNGDDSLFGGTGNDFLFGGRGADALDGGDGIDWAMYNDSSHGVIVNLGGVGSGGIYSDGDTYTGIERVRGSSFDDNIIMDGGNNTVLGDLGNDIIFGLGGRDSLRAGAGDDYLSGGSGKDYLFGEAGADTFDFNSGFGQDFVADFENDIDTIQLRGGLDNGNVAGMSIADILSTYATQINANRVDLNFGNGDILKIVSGTAFDITDLIDDMVVV